MRIMNKRLEVKVRSLQESLDRKDVENAELTNLCDELIGKLDRNWNILVVSIKKFLELLILIYTLNITWIIIYSLCFVNKSK